MLDRNFSVSKLELEGSVHFDDVNDIKTSEIELKKIAHELEQEGSVSFDNVNDIKTSKNYTKEIPYELEEDRYAQEGKK